MSFTAYQQQQLRGFRTHSDFLFDKRSTQYLEDSTYYVEGPSLYLERQTYSVERSTYYLTVSPKDTTVKTHSGKTWNTTFEVYKVV